MRSTTATLIDALRILSREIYCEDGVATAAIAEAADRIEEQAAEIASLRLAIRRLAEQDATLSVQGGNVTVTMDATLTNAERAVLEWAIEVSDSLAECGATGTGGKESHESATLRGLLERLA